MGFGVVCFLAVEICLFGIFGLFLFWGERGGLVVWFFKAAIATANQFIHKTRMIIGEIQLSF